MKKIVIFILLFVSVIIRAQVLTLDSVLQAIEAKNPSLKKYKFITGALNANAGGARNWDAPLVGVGTFMMPYSSPGNGSIMLSVQQMIPNPSKLSSKEKLMLAMSNVQSENANAWRNKIFSQAKYTYYSWLILKRKQKVLEENKSILELMIRQSEIAYAYEQGKAGNAYKAKSNLYQLESSLISLANDMVEKRTTLNSLMNRQVPDSLDIDTGYIIRNYEMNSLDTAILISNRGDIKAVNQSIRLVKLNLNYLQSKSKPDFGIRYDNMYALSGDMTRFNLMGMFTIPITPWSSREYKAGITAGNYEIKAYEEEKNALVNEAGKKVLFLTNAIKNKKRQVDLYEKNILPALENNYRLSLIAYKQNTQDMPDVLEALQALEMAKLQRLDQLQELLILQTAYEEQMQIR